MISLPDTSRDVSLHSPNGHRRHGAKENDAFGWCPDFIFTPHPPKTKPLKGDQSLSPESMQPRVEPECPEESPLIRVTDRTLQTRRFDVLQQWEGCVVEIGDEEIVAEVRDLTDSTNAPEIVAILRSDIPEADNPLLVTGAFFYWTIGYNKSLGGQIQRISEIRFRRTPTWTKSKLEAIKRRAAQWTQDFNTI